MLRSTSGPKKGKVTEGWKKLRYLEHHNVYLSPHIVNVDEIGGTCGTHRKHDKCIHNCDLQTSMEETTWDTYIWMKRLY